MSFTSVIIVYPFALMWTYLSVSSMQIQTLLPYHHCCYCLIMTRRTFISRRKRLSVTALLDFNLNPLNGRQNCSVTPNQFLTIFMTFSFHTITPSFLGW